MRTLLLFALAIVHVATRADGRGVYYLDSLDGGRSNDVIAEQQASRDLDLTFSAGDPVENESIVSPIARKVYTVVAPEKPYIEVSRDADRPAAYYRLTEPPARRNGLDDVILVPDRSRKLMKLNGNNKGEVILELRVIANHDSM